MKILIDRKRLSDILRKDGRIELEGEMLAYEGPQKDCGTPGCKECGKPSYIVFVDTSEYERLWSEVTKDFDPTDDWGVRLRELYKEQPELEEKLSKVGQYGVPGAALKIAHERGGSHGDLRLRYQNANILLFPLKEYDYFKSEFSKGWKIMCEQGAYVKGDESALSERGVSIA